MGKEQGKAAPGTPGGPAIGDSPSQGLIPLSRRMGRFDTPTARADARDAEWRVHFHDGLEENASKESATAARASLTGVLPRKILLTHPEWFGKDPKRVMPEDMNVTDTLMFLSHAHILTPGLSKIVCSKPVHHEGEKLNITMKDHLCPFRGNPLTAVLSAVNMIVFPPKNERDEDYSKKFKKWIGNNNYDFLDTRIKALLLIIDHKKTLGKIIENNEFLLARKEPPVEETERKRLLAEIEELNPQTPITLNEAATSYSIGEFVLRFLGRNTGVEGEKPEIGVKLTPDEKEMYLYACMLDNDVNKE